MSYSRWRMSSLFLLRGLLLLSFPLSVVATEDPIAIEDVQRFTTALSQIKSYYVEPVANEQLFDDAIRGMLTGLDPHSEYLDREAFTHLKAHTSGEFAGLGIEVMVEGGYIKVVSPIDNTPAQRAGLKSGDYVIRIDNQPTRNLDLREAVAKMRGPANSEISLTVYRKSENKLHLFKFKRERIQIKSVQAELLEPGYAYLRLNNFQSQSGQELVKAIDGMQKQSRSSLQGLILDLRNNPGGLLEASIQVSDAFLNGGALQHDNLIVYTQGRVPGANVIAEASPGDVLNGAPMVVLVNEGSASAAEIVAGALQDHHRAVIMGQETFGKGSVQTLLPIGEERAIKLTTALYYTPGGRSIQATGIVPDVILDHPVFAPPKKTDELTSLLKEADLNNHLEAALISPTQTHSEQSNRLASDYGLQQAFNLLKGLHALQPSVAKKSTLAARG